MGVSGAVGIHGTGQPWSIGTRASHGCIRMTVPDVIDLFGRVLARHAGPDPVARVASSRRIAPRSDVAAGAPLRDGRAGPRVPRCAARSTPQFAPLTKK